MIFKAQRGANTVVWNEQKQTFIGNAELIAEIELFVSVMARIGDNPYLHLIDSQEALNIQVLEYEPDEYPEGTLDV
jgi:hypothetical protein